MMRKDYGSRWIGEEIGDDVGDEVWSMWKAEKTEVENGE